MAEFWALVGNENLKLRRRKFIWIALVVVLVISFGFSALIGIFTNVLGGWEYVNDSTLAEVCESNLEYYTERLQTETDPDLQRTDQIEICRNRILLDCGATWNDWRYTTGIVSKYAEVWVDGDAELAARLNAMIRDNDYIEYYRYLMEINDSNYASNPKIAEAANAGYLFCIENNINPNGEDWRYYVALEMSNALLELRRLEAYAEYSPDAVDEKLEAAKNTYVLLKYRLENNIRVNPGDSFQLMNTLMNLGSSENETSRLWDTLNTTISVTSIVQILSIILAAGMVASEFGKGTIKFLLITPASRWKILLSKYCSLLINMGLFFLTLFFGNLLFGVLFCGGSDFFLPILTAAGGEIKRSSPVLLLFGNYLLELVAMLVMTTLAFMISSLFRNSGAAVGISLLVLYGGNTVNSVLALVGADWGRYLLFANINLSQILRGASVFPRQSVGVAIVVLLLHMVVFLWTAFDAFDRKEV